MELLERRIQLDELDAALRAAASGQGSVVLVTGEAGAGKTTLVEGFVGASSAGRVLKGLCDHLLTPRPLGPFRDIAGQTSGRLEKVIESGSVAELADTLLEELQSPPRPVVVVVDDAHWADEATLDVIRFLGRRIDRIPALLVVTYRDDEVPADHPLRRTLGTVPPANIHRVPLEPLSPEAVARLAGGSDVAELYALTGGNPFYVSEVLATSIAEVSPTVQDAVMARVGRLDGIGRQCVEAAAVVPTRTERWLLDGCGVSEGIDEAERLGVLHINGDIVSFSHELARRAVERSLPPQKRRDVNQRILDVLIAAKAEPARLAHHAAQAGNPAAVSRYAPAAARKAAALESHREAVDHYEQALRHSERFAADELADLLEEYARECQIIGRHLPAKDALQQAIARRQETDGLEQLGADLYLLSEARWYLGEGEEAEKAATRAVGTLERLHPGPGLARAYAQRSKLAMLDFRTEEAILWGERSVELARRLDDPAVLAHTLCILGTARWVLGPGELDLLVEGLELAMGQGLTDEASRAHVNLANGHTNHMQYAQAHAAIEEGLVYCETHDLIARADYLLTTRAWCRMEQGDWSGAEADLESPLSNQDVSRVRALRVLAQIQVRRGDGEARTTLTEAKELAERTGERQHLCPISLAEAELAWLRGDLEGVAKSASLLLEVARQSGNGRWIGETALWLHRADILDETPYGTIEPYALQIAGRWREAAAHWAALGRTYEAADAMAQAAEPEPLLEALETLDGLGAVPRAAMVRRRLADIGVVRVPRGPRPATRESPAGLTARQTEVLRLLAEGLTYRQIADRLFVSVKTVDHHAAAVRIKLGVNTREDAVAAGRDLGILPAGEARAGGRNRGR